MQIAESLKLLLRFCGYVALAIGLFYVICALYFICRRWTVMEQSVSLQEGYSFSRTFDVGKEGSYLVLVQYNKVIPHAVLESILSRAFPAVFHVTVNGTITDSKSYKSGGAMMTVHHENTVSQIIGSFRARPSTTYHLDMRLTRSLPELAATSPRVKVMASYGLQNDAFIGAYYALVIGLLFIAIGAPSLRKRRVPFGAGDIS